MDVGRHRQGGRGGGHTHRVAARGILALLVAAGLSACGATVRGQAPRQDLASYVDPFIGTANGGDTFPGADVPFGMVQWSPDNSGGPGGYSYSGHTLRGFSLTHLSGAGCSAYGDVPFLPVTALPSGDPANAESATAGYYSVTLSSGVRAQLTVTQRTGFGRFTYPSGTQPVMLIKAGTSANRSGGATVSVVGDNEVVGAETSGGFCGAGDTYTVYFAVQFQQPFGAFGTWNGALTQAGSRAGVGAGTGAYVVATPAAGGVVRMKVGVSFVSTQNAVANLKAEDPGWSFQAVRAKATATWNRMLSAITVTGGTHAELTTFYTALYHSLLQPNVFSDVNGQYLGFDGRVHQARGYTQYANFSGWDIYRSEVQLLSLLAPQQTSDMMQSLVNDAAQGGWLPKWPLANGYTGVMNGDSADPIIADAYAFGARSFNVKSALAAMVHGATVVGSAPGGYVERPGLSSYLSLGYEAGHAATTLEYNTDDFAIAQLAQALGDTSIAQRFMRRAQGWQFLIDPASGFLEPLNAAGVFPSQFNPTSQAGYREGDAYQYNWLVPFNVAGLAQSLGGAATVIPRLNSFFQQLNAGPDAANYWAGNEPGLETPWEYDFLGDPSATTAVVRSVLATLYTPTPGGLPGNDDLGAMSSWYVWAAMGMYPEISGDPGCARPRPVRAALPAGADPPAQRPHLYGPLPRRQRPERLHHGRPPQREGLRANLGAAQHHHLRRHPGPDPPDGPRRRPFALYPGHAGHPGPAAAVDVGHRAFCGAAVLFRGQCHGAPRREPLQPVVGPGRAGPTHGGVAQPRTPGAERPLARLRTVRPVGLARAGQLPGRSRGDRRVQGGADRDAGARVRRLPGHRPLPGGQAELGEDGRGGGGDTR